jgi:hypothetical protein
MRRQQRKTTPRVRDGKVQRKNRTDVSPHYSNTRLDRPAVVRQRPGQGHRHLLTKRQLYQFIDLLPDWEELSLGLKAVLLAPAERLTMGWYRPGVVALCAWEREVAVEWDVDFIEKHRHVLDHLGVPIEPVFDTPEDEECCRPNLFFQVCRFTEASARGFQLMHVFLHELGHHHDRMTTRSRRCSSRGEGFAEQYANRYADRIWQEYFTLFGW